MYSTCIFCHRDLGANEAIEEFPVGRRIAFDPAKGRLWAVCRRCERWNLSPLETRWEAIEDCERRFRDTRRRVSTENIALARLSEGLELVRVGEPLRPEFAAWRYGDQFGRRRKRAIAYSAAGATAAGAVIVGGTIAGISMGAVFPGFNAAFQGWYRERVIHRTWDEHGEPIRIQFKHLFTSRLLPAAGEGEWMLHVDHADGWKRGSSKDKRTMLVSGEAAVDFASRLMARVNRRGGKKATIQTAVDRIEAAGHPERYLIETARAAEREWQAAAEARAAKGKGPPKQPHKPLVGSLAGLSPDSRLAVEMATREQTEREAMLGELKGLEATWRRAEEIARIADNLLVPEEIDAFIERERSSGARREGPDGPAADESQG